MTDIAVEVGPGTAPFLPHLNEELVVLGSTVVYVERDKGAARLLLGVEEDSIVVLGLAEHLGLKSNSAEVVVLPNVWGVLSGGGILKALPEIVRVVKPSGRVVVVETAGPVPLEEVVVSMQAQGLKLEREYLGKEGILEIFNDRKLAEDLVTGFGSECYAAVFRKP